MQPIVPAGNYSFKKEKSPDFSGPQENWFLWAGPQMKDSEPWVQLDQEPMAGGQSPGSDEGGGTREGL